jgi:Kinesin motor domain
MNAASSRSHSVLTLHISGRHDGSGERLTGALNLVDLAGRYITWSPCGSADSDS